MPTRTRIKKPIPQKTKEVEEVEVVEDDHLKALTDEILDEIDAMLEENAEQFVASYIQKGGQ